MRHYTNISGSWKPAWTAASYLLPTTNPLFQFSFSDSAPQSPPPCPGILYSFGPCLRFASLMFELLFHPDLPWVWYIECQMPICYWTRSWAKLECFPAPRTTLLSSIKGFTLNTEDSFPLALVVFLGCTWLSEWNKGISLPWRWQG